MRRVRRDIPGTFAGYSRGVFLYGPLWSSMVLYRSSMVLYGSSMGLLWVSCGAVLTSFLHYSYILCFPLTCLVCGLVCFFV